MYPQEGGTPEGRLFAKQKVLRKGEVYLLRYCCTVNFRSSRKGNPPTHHRISPTPLYPDSQRGYRARSGRGCLLQGVTWLISVCPCLFLRQYMIIRVLYASCSAALSKEDFFAIVITPLFFLNDVKNRFLFI